MKCGSKQLDTSIIFIGSRGPHKKSSISALPNLLDLLCPYIKVYYINSIS